MEVKTNPATHTTGRSLRKNNNMLLGFKKQFVQPIQLGTKVLTIRRKRKIQPKIGERLYMYTGLRTANCEKISDNETLISVQKVHLHIYRITNYTTINIKIDGRYLTESEMRKLAVYDGFYSLNHFINYWLENEGVKKGGAIRAGGWFDIFHWTDLKF